MDRTRTGLERGRAWTLADAWAQSRTRGNNFDAIRLFAAALVIFSHSFEMVDGTRANEPLEVLSGQISLGELGVLIFFAVSGFLITKSWQSAPDLPRFFWKRALRILPALATVAVLLALLIGPLLSARSAGDYFTQPDAYVFLLNAVFINAQQTLPGVFETSPYPGSVNAPLWTLAFEAVCYAIIAILGAARLLKPASCAVIMVAFLLILTFPAIHGDQAFGNFVFKLALLGPSFFAGSVAALAARKIPLDSRLAALAAGGLLAATLTNGLTPAFAVCGTYLVLYVAFAPLGGLRSAGRFGDFSYGLYLWGWPAQQIVQQAIAPENAFVNFAAALPLALLAAILSWRLVESPALALKERLPLPRQAAAH